MSRLRSKYRNTPNLADGFKFDSQLETKRYFALKVLEATGEISDLRVHPRFALHCPTLKGMLECVGHYVGDFSYRCNDKIMVEDCKSPATQRLPMYRWKKRQMLLEHGIEIQEIVR